ncbi:2'-5' RNA ligase family protein [Tenggerimyces flavus]|uniref:2'-5' RNA ligase family protein n=1 Tax=Tenggerimyces flavus TaxID=1708749 RepID=A0ABV7YJ60_9ACTN|nr:2'-5' RNA ligase family protein [Tenggerimyces flavus]MBM7789589.1 2'-5' RNA ligase [Tenggerimyces flavus]
MPLAIELYFDEPAEESVRTAWGALEHAGIPVLPKQRGFDYRPHITLAVCEPADPERMVATLGSIASDLDIRVVLSGAGFFVDAERLIAFLTVTQSEELLHVHRLVTDALQAADRPRPHYARGAWTPHCTLPFEGSADDIIDVLREEASLPISATVSGMHLIDLETERLIAKLDRATTVPVGP